MFEEWGNYLQHSLISVKYKLDLGTQDQYLKIEDVHNGGK